MNQNWISFPLLSMGHHEYGQPQSMDYGVLGLFSCTLGYCKLKGMAVLPFTKEAAWVVVIKKALGGVLVTSMFYKAWKNSKKLLVLSIAIQAIATSITNNLALLATRCMATGFLNS